MDIPALPFEQVGEKRLQPKLETVRKEASTDEELKRAGVQERCAPCADLPGAGDSCSEA